MFEVQCGSFAELLEAANCADKDELERMLEGMLECYMFIEEDPYGVLVMVINHASGVVEPYPCTLGDLLWDAEDLLSERCMLDQIESVVEAIAELEGLDVEIEVDLDIIDETVLQACDRRVSHASSAVLQDIGDYPFDEPFPSDRTVAEWVAERFLPTFPGWKVWISGHSEVNLDG